MWPFKKKCNKEVDRFNKDIFYKSCLASYSYSTHEVVKDTWHQAKASGRFITIDGVVRYECKILWDHYPYMKYEVVWLSEVKFPSYSPGTWVEVKWVK